MSTFVSSHRSLFALVASLVAACSSSAEPAPSTPAGDGGAVVADAGPSGANAVHGSVAGVSLAAASALAIDYSTSTGAPRIAIAISTHANLCSLAGSPANATTLDLDVDAAGQPSLGPGTYAIATPLVSATIVRADATCQQTLSDAHAGSGTITITTIDSTHVAGSFSLKFPSGSLDGTFDAPFCARPASGPSCAD